MRSRGRPAAGPAGRGPGGDRTRGRGRRPRRPAVAQVVPPASTAPAIIGDLLADGEDLAQACLV